MRLRLILSFTLIVLVSVATVVLIARLTTANEVRAFMFRGGASGSTGMVNNLEAYYLANGSWQGVESLLTSRGGGMGRGGPPGSGGAGFGNANNQSLLLADAQGNVVANSSGSNTGGKLTNAQLNSAISLQVGGKTVGYLLPEGAATFTPSEESQLVTRLNQVALTAGLIAGGISLLLALLLAYRFLKPIRGMTAAARQLAQGDLNQRVPVQGNDELATLGHTFNQMAISLQQAEQSRRAMTADIAHELRNPLAVQRANLEALQDGIYPLTPENLEPILEQNRLLTHLVEDLRTLALAESGQLTLERAPVNFPALVKSIIERFGPQADARQIVIDLNCADSIPTLSLDPFRIEQILGNLLSNALRYTPQNGRIHLDIQSYVRRNNTQMIQLDLHDSGPGIPEESLPHVFERFYRADRSRSRAEGGTGLGLAIARQLAEAHGGSLSAKNHPQGGAVFTMTIPVET
jgi:two-component system sensor histidine kinase BaeS